MSIAMVEVVVVKKPDRIASLDGWRGIAVLMVLADHIINAAAAGAYPRPWMRTGLHGVTLFFVLSGFLITSNLISGPINLRKFYVRRFFRLMPTAWAFLITLLAFDFITGNHLTSWREIQGCLLFYRNFQGAVGIAGHFWSLSIEEQFYLVWPALLLLAGLRKSGWVAMGGIALVAIYRLALWNHYQQGLLYTRTEIRADALLVGCIAALLANDHRATMTKWSARLVLPSLGFFVLAIYCCHVLQPLWESASIGVLILFATLHPEALSSRVLGWTPLAWIGGISYTVYVWQEPFMLLVGNRLFFLLPVFILACHYAVERPLRRYGRHLSDRLIEARMPPVPV